MNDHTRRLVNDEEVFVLVGDSEWNVFADNLTRHLLRRLDHYDVAGERAIARFFSPAVYRDVSICNEGRRLITRQVGALGYKQVEANVAVRLDDKFAPSLFRLSQISRLAGDTGDAGIGATSDGSPPAGRSG